MHGVLVIMVISGNQHDAMVRLNFLFFLNINFSNYSNNFPKKKSDTYLGTSSFFPIIIIIIIIIINFFD